MRYPNLKEEKKLWKKGYKFVVGLDESGRGPLAGLVIAGAVVIQSGFRLQALGVRGIKDSKKLSPKKREEFYKILINHSQIKWGIGKVSEKVIDRINIQNATELAMFRAIKNLEKKYSHGSICITDFLIIDGNRLNSKKLKAKSYKLIIKADEKVFSCAAASIIAKVSRDRRMRRYHKKYPNYGFDKHKGYGTKLHQKMLKKYGYCSIHRKSFKPIKFLKIKKLKKVLYCKRLL